MVKYKNIIRAIENYVIKCPTIAEMKSELGKMEYEEQFDQLQEQSLLNPLEVEDCQSLINIVRHHEKNLANPTMVELLKKNGMWEKDVKRYNDSKNQLFQYGRRLIEGLKRNDAPQIDTNSFKEDKQFKSVSSALNEMGDMEQAQIESQFQYLNKETITKAERDEMNQYFAGDLNNINSTIYNKDIYNSYKEAYEKEVKKRVKNLDSIIGKSGGLIEDTLLYRGGELVDIHLNVGDHGKFKGYASVSYQKISAEEYKSDRKSHFLYKIYSPKGTKGIVGNGRYFSNGYGEHEYVLSRDQGFTVMDVDYDNQIIEILLDES